MILRQNWHRLANEPEALNSSHLNPNRTRCSREGTPSRPPDGKAETRSAVRALETLGIFISMSATSYRKNNIHRFLPRLMAFYTRPKANARLVHTCR